MINVHVERTRETNRITSFTISGHANSGPPGYDIVCAAVSALSIGTVNAVEKLCDVKLPVEAGEKGGYLRCKVTNNLKVDTERDVQLLIEGMLVGLNDIAKQYREFITVKQKTT